MLSISSLMSLYASCVSADLPARDTLPAIVNAYIHIHKDHICKQQSQQFLKILKLVDKFFQAKQVMLGGCPFFIQKKKRKKEKRKD